MTLSFDGGEEILVFADYYIVAYGDLYGNIVDSEPSNTVSYNNALGRGIIKKKAAELTKKEYEYKLLGNYPNPFNPSTTIKYSVAEPGLVSLKVYDILGREIGALVNEVKTPGVYEVEFNASSLSSGVYLYKLQTENGVILTKKLVLLK